MPILQNAKKALKVSKRKAKVNAPVRSRLKTTVDAVAKKADLSSLGSAFSAIDKAVKRHIIHRKKGDRMKSQLSKKMVKTEPAAKAKAAPKAAPKAKAAKTVKKAAKK